MILYLSECRILSFSQEKCSAKVDMLYLIVSYLLNASMSIFLKPYLHISSGLYFSGIFLNLITLLY